MKESLQAGQWITWPHLPFDQITVDPNNFTYMAGRGGQRRERTAAFLTSHPLHWPLQNMAVFVIKKQFNEEDYLQVWNIWNDHWVNTEYKPLSCLKGVWYNSSCLHILICVIIILSLPIFYIYLPLPLFWHWERERAVASLSMMQLLRVVQTCNLFLLGNFKGPL